MQTTPDKKSRIIVALDFADPAQALDFVTGLQPGRCRLKVGKELFTRAGPALVGQLAARGFDVFLDLKFHDIPNTVAGACAAAADLGVWMMNVHALGGRRMMEAARAAVDKSGCHCHLIAVTVLTSMAEQDLLEIGLTGDAQQNVTRLAALAQEAGMDGVVCSPREVALLRAGRAADFLLVTPGIRPRSAQADDQRRVMTPAEAIEQGASYLVIGRPVTAAPDPLQALLTIESEIAALL
jgi:orotidine-5'-phosphate decarboxylase